MAVAAEEAVLDQPAPAGPGLPRIGVILSASANHYAKALAAVTSVETSPLTGNLGGHAATGRISSSRARHYVTLSAMRQLDPGHRAAYQMGMPVRVFRQILFMLLVAAYLSATVFVTAPVAYAAPSGMSAMAMQQNGTADEMPMPCSKGMKAGCVTELGCVLMVSLRAPDLTITAAIDWLPVTYSVAAEFLEGRSMKPALGPPRSFT